MPVDLDYAIRNDVPGRGPIDFVGTTTLAVDVSMSSASSEQPRAMSEVSMLSGAGRRTSCISKRLEEITLALVALTGFECESKNGSCNEFGFEHLCVSLAYTTATWRACSLLQLPTPAAGISRAWGLNQVADSLWIFVHNVHRQQRFR